MLFYHVSIFIFVIDVIEISQSTTNPNIVQGYFDLSNHGFEFITYDSQALILAEISQSMLTCILKCNLIAHCRTFNYDTVIKLWTFLCIMSTKSIFSMRYFYMSMSNTYIL